MEGDPQIIERVKAAEAARDTLNGTTAMTLTDMHIGPPT